MKIRTFPFSLLILLLFAATSCEMIEGPKVDPSGFSGSTNKVLLEDFTGHLCGSCPNAHAHADALREIYGENLVVVAVHAGSFARVVPSLGYSYDFNTPLGTALAQEYDLNNSSLPKGIINRREWNAEVLQEYADWGTHISTILAEDAKLGIAINTAYQEDARQLDVEVKMEYYSPGTAEHQLVVIITEDSIISKQENYSIPQGHDDFYVHNHVLRASITPETYGTPVKGNTIFIGENITKNFSITLPDAFNARNCHIVAYVLDKNTHEVYQVEESALLP